ncbi:box A-binding factor-like [Macrosteles quadrilineatus]|uniref:box A-binding factor-like n=1 Tax=Macrosteles quadrilineatus TaxID=74068 RepID=UPI0023E1C8A6|nr:box A-binding factor-like [Macrosteles quadrilineatus]
MANSKLVCVLCVLFSLTYVLCEVEDLQPIYKSTEETLQKAKTHVDHMLNMSPLPNAEKIPSLVKNESEHMAHEIKKLATHLQEKIATGEHSPEMKEAVNAAVTHLNEAAETLHGAGSDLKQDNTKYYEAAEKLLGSAKSIMAVGPCPEISPVLKGALHELTHDINNYQYGIHDMIGPHEGGPSEGHIEEHNHHHHIHKHNGQSSEEESQESKEKSSSGHSHHHHH